MTVDDENSVYVGGLPYDSTEDSVRRAFEIYGTVIAVKSLMIVNDRDFGGKCYGFVTFTNPRAAVNAIKDMDGRVIGGRIVRVNEVKSKSSRTSFTRDNHFRDLDRDRDSRERERNKDGDRERYRDRARDTDRDRDWDEDWDQDRDRDLRLRNRTGASRYISSPIKRKLSPTNINSTRKRILHERDSSPRGRSLSGGSTSDKKQDVSLSPSPKRAERSMRAAENSNRQRVKEELEKAIKKHDDLKHEIARMEEESDKKSLLISEMHKKSQKLEESIALVRKATLQRETQFRKMQSCFLQIKDYTEKLKSSEEELQSLVDASILDMSGLEDRCNED
ncbi:hypothetical protein SUGI_0598680 [Cryptomeria japonica]|nr:hypothetical protein SUGI_0598680 [Cryptomeria japonica]